MGQVIHVNTVIAVHLVIHGYGHWLANDLRGSGSTELRQEKFEDLGPVHTGRKRVQPSKKDLRAFYKEAEGLLKYPTIWFDEPARLVIASALEQVCKKGGYTAWACAVLQNHAHLLLRTHRDKGDLMWENAAVAARDALWDAGLVTRGHPVWSNRPYFVFKTNVPMVRRCVKYVEENPEKHGLASQIYPWVVKYDGYPFHKKHK
jgi:REP element-mobilizing transposase RayT